MYRINGENYLVRPSCPRGSTSNLNQDLPKLTLKRPYVGANGIPSQPHVVPVGKSCKCTQCGHLARDRCTSTLVEFAVSIQLEQISAQQNSNNNVTLLEGGHLEKHDPDEHHNDHREFLFCA